MGFFSCCCPGPTGANFTLHATECNVTPYPGVSVTVAAGATAVASGATDAAGNFVTPLAPGAYTVTLADPNGITLTFALTMTASAQTVNKNFLTSLSAAVTNSCGGGGLAGASLTFVQGGTTLGTATTGPSGFGTITLTTNIPLTAVTVTAVYKGTTQTCTGTPTTSCPTLCTVQYKDTITVTVKGCNNLNLPGASVSASPGGGSATTDASGVATITPGVGLLAGASVTATVTSARFATGAVTFTGCSGSIALTPTSSYVCVPGCVQPLSKALTCTDPQGAVPLNYDATQGVWVGCAMRNATTVRQNPGCVVASGVTQVPVQFEWTGSDFGLAWPSCGFTSTNDWVRTDTCSTNVGAPWSSYGNIVLTPLPYAAGRTTTGPTCPTAFSYSTTLHFLSGRAPSYVYGTGASTFSLSE